MIQAGCIWRSASPYYVLNSFQGYSAHKVTDFPMVLSFAHYSFSDEEILKGYSYFSSFFFMTSGAGASTNVWSRVRSDFKNLEYNCHSRRQWSHIVKFRLHDWLQKDKDARKLAIEMPLYVCEKAFQVYCEIRSMTHWLQVWYRKP